MFRTVCTEQNFQAYTQVQAVMSLYDWCLMQRVTLISAWTPVETSTLKLKACSAWPHGYQLLSILSKSTWLLIASVLTLKSCNPEPYKCHSFVQCFLCCWWCLTTMWSEQLESIVYNKHCHATNRSQLC